MNARLFPDSFYVNGNIIPASYFQDLDTAQYQAVNASSGGTWDPSSGIQIAGGGMGAMGPWSLGSSPAIEVPAGSSMRLTHGDSDWVGLGNGHSGATRLLYTSLGTAADTSYWLPGAVPSGTALWQAGAPYVVGNVVVPTTANGFVYECTSISGSGTSGGSPPSWPTTIGSTVTDDPGADQVVWTCVQATAVGVPRLAYYAATHGACVQPPATVFAGGARLTAPLRVHNGATLAGPNIEILFFIGNAHTGGLPQTFPQMRVLRLDMEGNAVPLCTDPTVAGWQGNGWVNVFGSTLPSSPSVYYQSGAESSVLYTVDAGTVVDTSQYAYLVQVQDEAGANSVGGNTFFAAASGNGSIPDLRPQ